MCVRTVHIIILRYTCAGPEIVIAVLATLIFIALCVAGGCCLVVEIFR